MIEEKKALRKFFAQVRDAICAEEYAEINRQILHNIIASQYYKNAETIFTYVSFGSEVDTSALIKEALSNGKRVAVPKCNLSEHTICFYEIKSLSQLKEGAYKIPEPSDELLENGAVKLIEKADLAIIPALAFDKRGMRLGYGGGYYDRFLKDFDGISIGVSPRQCITEKLPTGEYDCAVDVVFCPEEMITSGI